LFKELIWKAADIVWKKLNQPTLVMDEINIDVFRFPSNIGDHYRIFLYAKIRNDGVKRAKQCCPQLRHLNTDNIFYLHWSDTTYAPLRNSTEKIDLEPNEYRDLDIVFTVLGSRVPPVEPSTRWSNITSGEIAFNQKNEVQSSERLRVLPSAVRGTYDPSVMEYVLKTTSPDIIRTNLSDNMPLKGAWIATPYACYDPEGYQEAWLEPGKHDLDFFITLSEGSGLAYRLSINVDESPIGLTCDKKSIIKLN
jgi:hypothetical protein